MPYKFNQKTKPSTQNSNYYIPFQHVCFKVTITTIPVTDTQNITSAYFIAMRGIDVMVFKKIRCNYTIIFRWRLMHYSLLSPEI
jgi:hypothetical protein